MKENARQERALLRTVRVDRNDPFSAHKVDRAATAPEPAAAEPAAAEPAAAATSHHAAPDVDAPVDPVDPVAPVASVALAAPVASAAPTAPAAPTVETVPDAQTALDSMSATADSTSAAPSESRTRAEAVRAGGDDGDDGDDGDCDNDAVGAATSISGRQRTPVTSPVASPVASPASSPSASRAASPTPPRRRLVTPPSSPTCSPTATTAPRVRSVVIRLNGARVRAASVAPRPADVATAAALTTDETDDTAEPIVKPEPKDTDTDAVADPAVRRAKARRRAAEDDATTAPADAGSADAKARARSRPRVCRTCNKIRCEGSAHCGARSSGKARQRDRQRRNPVVVRVATDVATDAMATDATTAAAADAPPKDARPVERLVGECSSLPRVHVSCSCLPRAPLVSLVVCMCTRVQLNCCRVTTRSMDSAADDRSGVLDSDCATHARSQPTRSGSFFSAGRPTRQDAPTKPPASPTPNVVSPPAPNPLAGRPLRAPSRPPSPRCAAPPRAATAPVQNLATTKPVCLAPFLCSPHASVD